MSILQRLGPSFVNAKYFIREKEKGSGLIYFWNVIVCKTMQLREEASPTSNTKQLSLTPIPKKWIGSGKSQAERERQCKRTRDFKENGK